MTAPDDALASMLRRIVREEIERAEARRRGERPAGKRRIRSLALAAKLAEEISGPVDDVTKARVRQALRRERGRRQA